MAGPAPGRPDLPAASLPWRITLRRGAWRRDTTCSVSPTAALPLRTKMPAPMTAPRAVKLYGPRDLPRRYSGPADSAMSLSILLVRALGPQQMAAHCSPSPEIESLCGCPAKFFLMACGSYSCLRQPLAPRLAPDQLLHFPLVGATVALPFSFGGLFLACFPFQLFAFCAILDFPCVHKSKEPQLPATVISLIFNVGEATDPRNSRSVPTIAIPLNISSKLPATVTSSTG